MMNTDSKVDFAEAFKTRTKKFTVDIIKLYQTLPKTDEARIIGKQLIRCASSVGSNYRAACRARSEAEFFAKMSIVVEEADESVFWPDILDDTEIAERPKIRKLMEEAIEILKIVASARKTTSNRINNSK